MPFLFRKISKTNSHHRGFTMIELAVVLIVLGIITVAVASRYIPLANELMAEVDGLKASLSFAQIQSMDDDTPGIKWGLHFPDSSTYRLYKNNSDASSTMIPVKGSSGDPETGACAKNCHELQGNVQMSSGVGTTINFDRWGRPLDGLGNLRTEDTSLELVQGAEKRLITIRKNTGYVP